MWLPWDRLVVEALADEEADTCRKCGLPKAWCRDNEAGRARFDVKDEFCWATYRVGLRQAKTAKENVPPAQENATILSATFREGREPPIDAGLELPEVDRDGPVVSG